MYAGDSQVVKIFLMNKTAQFFFVFYISVVFTSSF